MLPVLMASASTLPRVILVMVTCVSYQVLMVSVFVLPLATKNYLGLPVQMVHVCIYNFDLIVCVMRFQCPSVLQFCFLSDPSTDSYLVTTVTG